MPDGCWRVRLLWEQKGWVPVGGVMGEGGGGGQAVSAIGSDGKGWSRGPCLLISKSVLFWGFVSTSYCYF